MIKILSLLLAFQTNPYSGTYTSISQTLVFLNGNKCTLTIPASWDSYKQREFKWKIIDDTMVLSRFGTKKYSFRIVKHNEHIYLVDIKHFEYFTSYLLTVEHKPPKESDTVEFENYSIAKEKIDSTLKKRIESRIK